MADNYTSIEEREALKHWGCLTLTDKQLKRALKSHGVSYKTADGFVHAWDSWVTREGKEEGKWVKMSGWGTIKVREWLGY